MGVIVLFCHSPLRLLIETMFIGSWIAIVSGGGCAFRGCRHDHPMVYPNDIDCVVVRNIVRFIRRSQ